MRAGLVLAAAYSSTESAPSEPSLSDPPDEKDSMVNLALRSCVAIAGSVNPPSRNNCSIAPPLPPTPVPLTLSSSIAIGVRVDTASAGGGGTVMRAGLVLAAAYSSAESAPFTSKATPGAASGAASGAAVARIEAGGFMGTRSVYTGTAAGAAEMVAVGGSLETLPPPGDAAVAPPPRADKTSVLEIDD